MKKLSKDKIEEISGYVEKGLPQDSVAALAGVGLPTYQGWLRRAKTDDDHDPLIYQLALAINAAKGRFVARNVDNVQTAGDSGSYQASQWLLEKRDSKNFGKKKEEDDTPPRVIVVPAVEGTVEDWMEKHGKKKEGETQEP